MELTGANSAWQANPTARNSRRNHYDNCGGCVHRGQRLRRHTIYGCQRIFLMMMPRHRVCSLTQVLALRSGCCSHADTDIGFLFGRHTNGLAAFTHDGTEIVSERNIRESYSDRLTFSMAMYCLRILSSGLGRFFERYTLHPFSEVFDIRRRRCMEFSAEVRVSRTHGSVIADAPTNQVRILPYDFEDIEDAIELDVDHPYGGGDTVGGSHIKMIYSI